MSREKFAGLCIGGPMAGQQVVNQSQILKCEERPPLKSALEASLSDSPPRCRDKKCPSARGPIHHHGWPEIKTHTYHWTSIGPFALWIHESTDLNHALDAMAQAYQEKHSGNRK